MIDAKLLLDFLGAIEGLRILEHSSHVNAQSCECGCGFMEEHLLLERLYTPWVDAFDGIAEHAGALSGILSPCAIAREALARNEAWEKAEPKSTLRRCLLAEEYIQKAIRALVAKVKDENIGLDDELRTLANSRSFALYALRRATQGETDRHSQGK